MSSVLINFLCNKFTRYDCVQSKLPSPFPNILFWHNSKSLADVRYRATRRSTTLVKWLSRTAAWCHLFRPPMQSSLLVHSGPRVSTNSSPRIKERADVPYLCSIRPTTQCFEPMKDMFSSLRLQGRSYSSAPLFDLHHLMTVTFGFSFLRRPG